MPERIRSTSEKRHAPRNHFTPLHSSNQIGLFTSRKFADSNQATSPSDRLPNNTKFTRQSGVTSDITKSASKLTLSIVPIRFVCSVETFAGSERISHSSSCLAPAKHRCPINSCCLPVSIHGVDNEIGSSQFKSFQNFLRVLFVKKNPLEQLLQSIPMNS